MTKPICPKCKRKLLEWDEEELFYTCPNCYEIFTEKQLESKNERRVKQ